jgi:carboxyl-terminal processing protease
MPRKSLILFLAVVVAGALGVSRAFSQEPYEKEVQTLKRIIEHVQDDYATEVDSKKLWEGAYRGALESLNDPFTQFFNAPEASRFSAETEGKFGGLGIEISLKDGILTVITPIKGTPAYNGGILAGDEILKIDGKSTERLDLEAAVGTLRGKIGTKVTLTVQHIGAPVTTEITLTREEIKPASVEGAMLDPKNGIGYIQISQFTETCRDDMLSAVADLKKQDLKAMVIDLRGNPGGLLDKAVDIADDFLASGVIVSVRGRQPEMNRIFNAHKGQSLESLPIIVIVDEGSASASEIVAAALHDNNRSLLVGGRTYGKGSVQNVIPLGNGETLKMTTAHYYRPNGQPIEFHQGIMPDIYLPMSREHELALRNQEREDKLRGRFRLGADIVDEGPSAPEPTAAPAPATTSNTPDSTGPAGENHKKDPEETHRNRVVDFQLQAALNILKWQLTHPTALPEVGGSGEKAEK